jgi:hypothetical protein
MPPACAGTTSGSGLKRSTIAAYCGALAARQKSLRLMFTHRERVRPIRDAFTARGVEVLRELQVPGDRDRESWIRQHFAESKCATVFGSSALVARKHVHHEASIANEQGKLIHVMLEPVTILEFPLGLHAREAANLSNWTGEQDNEDWRSLWLQCEAKLTPLRIRNGIEEKDAKLLDECARRESAESHNKTQASGNHRASIGAGTL